MKKFSFSLQPMGSLTYMGPQMAHKSTFIYYSECTLSFPRKMEFKKSVIAMYIQNTRRLDGSWDRRREYQPFSL